MSLSGCSNALCIYPALDGAACAGRANLKTEPTSLAKEDTMALRHWSGAALAAMTIGMAGIALAAPKTEDFIRDAGAANTFEIESAKIAANKALSPAIKDYARMIINDHTKV